MKESTVDEGDKGAESKVEDVCKDAYF